jgi:hypothetical protein
MKKGKGLDALNGLDYIIRGVGMILATTAKLSALHWKVPLYICVIYIREFSLLQFLLHTDI